MNSTALALAAALMTAAAAHAAPSADLPRVAVRVNTLDLSQAADVKRLMDRLETASLEVCGAPAGSDRAVVQATRNSACYNQALKSAVADARSPALSLAYATAHRRASTIKMASR